MLCNFNRVHTGYIRSLEVFKIIFWRCFASGWPLTATVLRIQNILAILFLCFFTKKWIFFKPSRCRETFSHLENISQPWSHNNNSCNYALSGRALFDLSPTICRRWWDGKVNQRQFCSVSCQLEAGCRIQMQKLPPKSHISKSISGRSPEAPETGC